MRANLGFYDTEKYEKYKKEITYIDDYLNRLQK